MGTDEFVCPACEQPVATVVRRRKTLGAFVPVWGPGPCHNPRCEACAESGAFPASRDLGEAGSSRWPRDPRDPGDPGRTAGGRWTADKRATERS
ncbi:hypothetical protein GFH48_14775 [Streptomyces fagopyri]|uniref:Uncharacterized protein n=1 Tax=Streptomyces fagopyri TaxID=2662397 RepID=A0A5Q0LBR4_9ACTN|nr:hypothetical protein [Streptomyces fagopyri]QFZ74351.1 hypothetical protein GFH48_14775 [Streptomyces fagopyri]